MMRRLRRMLGRAALDDDEVQILLGVARQMSMGRARSRGAKFGIDRPPSLHYRRGVPRRAMPEPTPTGAVDLVERQVRRVRRRKNLYELQRTLYLAIAPPRPSPPSSAAARALRARRGLFATVAVGALAVLAAGIAMALAGGLHRRWLARERTLAWIEAQRRPRWTRADAPRAGVAPRDDRGSSTRCSCRRSAPDSPTGRRVASCRARIPRAAGAMAVIALAVLVVAFRLAVARAPGRAHGRHERSAARRRRPDRPARSDGRRTRGGRTGRPRDRGEQSAPATADDRDDDSTLTQLSSAFQENVRQQVWGKAWERVRDALARAGTTGGSGGTRDEAGERAEELDGEGSGEWEVARAPSATSATAAAIRGVGPEPSEHDDATAARHRGDRRRPRHPRPTRTSTTAATGNSGAGNGTVAGRPLRRVAGRHRGRRAPRSSCRSPRACGADRVGRRGAGGPAPDADPDAQPALAAEQRRETAAHRMAVPAAYEQVVREVFAHRGGRHDARRSQPRPSPTSRRRSPPSAPRWRAS